MPLKTPLQLWIVFLGRVYVIESEPRVQHEKTVFETIAGLFQVLLEGRLEARVQWELVKREGEAGQS